MAKHIARSKQSGTSGGLDLRRRLLGDEAVTRMDSSVHDGLREVRENLLEHAWTAAWTREGLDLRTRSFMTIALLVALDRPRELLTHLKVATANGLSQSEIAEAIFHSAAYCGVPAGMGAISVASDFFFECDEKSVKKGEKVVSKGVKNSHSPKT